MSYLRPGVRHVLCHQAHRDGGGGLQDQNDTWLLAVRNAEMRDRSVCMRPSGSVSTNSHYDTYCVYDSRPGYIIQQRLLEILYFHIRLIAQVAFVSPFGMSQVNSLAFNQSGFASQPSVSLRGCGFLAGLRFLVPNALIESPSPNCLSLGEPFT